MTEKVGRNDSCPCGSGKKYKQCCLLKKSSAGGLGKRKFTAKIISSGGQAHKPKESTEEQRSEFVDYNTLMERSFGQAIHSVDEKPPIPENPSAFLIGDNEKANSNEI